MTFEEIVRRGRELKQETPEDWPAPAVRVARSLDAHLANPGSLKRIVSELIDVAHRLGCDSVAGASPLGERLAGAIVASSDDLRLFSAVTPGPCVLLVDGMLATGTQLLHARQLARSVGARHTPAVALMADRDALDALRHELGDEVVALSEF